ASTRRERRARRRPQGALDDAARRLHRPGFTRGDVRPSRARCQRHRHHGLRGARAESAWRGGEDGARISQRVRLFGSTRDLFPLLAGFREADGDGLFAAFHLSAASTAPELSAFALAHRPLHILRRTARISTRHYSTPYQSELI